MFGGRFPGPASGKMRQANVHESFKEGSRREHHSACCHGVAGTGPHARDHSVVRQDPVYGACQNGQVFLFRQRLLHACGIQFFVALHSGGSNGWALPRIKYPELDAGLIGIHTHLPAKSIQFLY